MSRPSVPSTPLCPINKKKQQTALAEVGPGKNEDACAVLSNAARVHTWACCRILIGQEKLGHSNGEPQDILMLDRKHFDGSWVVFVAAGDLTSAMYHQKRWYLTESSNNPFLQKVTGYGEPQSRALFLRGFFNVFYSEFRSDAKDSNDDPYSF